MKLNDRTLTGITAVLLAIGVGAAGVFLRSETEVVAAKPEYASLEGPSLSALEPSVELPIIPASVATFAPVQPLAKPVLLTNPNYG